MKTSAAGKEASRIGRPGVAGMLTGALLLSLPSVGWAEGDPVYSYTRIELDTGKAGKQPGSQQTLKSEGWIGGDFNRFWWRAEAERSRGRTETSEVQALYSRYVAPFWDLQGGIRHDLRPSSENYAVIGLRGLAPYSFDVDLQAFVRSDGKLLARARFENDFLITNRLIARPFVYGQWSASNLGAKVRSGLYRAEAGIQVRYEITRKVAPYIEVSRSFYPGAAAGSGLRPTNEVRVGMRLIF